jgi:hypothetical protein
MLRIGHRLARPVGDERELPGLHGDTTLPLLRCSPSASPGVCPKHTVEVHNATDPPAPRAPPQHDGALAHGALATP